MMGNNFREYLASLPDFFFFQIKQIGYILNIHKKNKNRTKKELKKRQNKEKTIQSKSL